MKRLSFLFILAIGLVLAACSSASFPTPAMTILRFTQDRIRQHDGDAQERRDRRVDEGGGAALYSLGQQPRQRLRFRRYPDRLPVHQSA
jgi:hypothetical protein